ncbi:MAG: M1 family metallopeptidase [Gemmatimonadota bacterium]|nr:MAG: M1 family metallopeptidase [Gemmatimonadota bacterium]
MTRTPTSRIASLAVVAAASTAQLSAQTAGRPIPYPVVPSRGFELAIERGTRTTDGTPGPRYWQQWTEYQLSARLMPERRLVEGRASIVYRNRSPNPLTLVALQLLQNLHASGAVRNRAAQVTGGVELRSVMLPGLKLEPREQRDGPGYTVDGTIVRVYPPQPIQPGATLSISVDWAFTVPQAGAGARMGWSENNLFHIAYWYPQVAVFDDVDGWHTDQFLGRAEFYGGFASYDLTVAAPEGWVVMATGELLNPEQVLASRVLGRYREAHESDDVVHVITADDFGPGRATGISPDGYLRWRFHADSVRDVAFSAMSESLWDAARTPVGDKDGDGTMEYALVNAFWRTTAPKWSNAWRYAQHSIDFLSRWTGLPYPWPHVTSVEGGGIIGGGMEFPMMTLIGDYNQRSDSALYYVHAHELAHMWLPMMVNTDERRYAWMDEGMTTFNENQARKEFFPGVNHDQPDVASYLYVARSGLEGEMMRVSDYHYPGPAYGTASYSKPATTLVALRGLLGEETFLLGLRDFIGTWAFKHPKPWDLFNIFDRVSGEDLDWFWRSWYYETWVLDHEVAAVSQMNGTATILIRDRGWVPMPARVTITLADGTVLTREVPVRHWLAGNTTAEIMMDVDQAVTRVEIDAAEAFPDIDRSNNTWERGN